MAEEQEKVGPNGSFWVGGADGGVFIQVSPVPESDEQRIYSGTVYDEFDEAIWYAGRFRLHGHFDFDPTNREHYLGWDGERILLLESSYLEALDIGEQ